METVVDGSREHLEMRGRRKNEAVKRAMNIIDNQSVFSEDQIRLLQLAFEQLYGLPH